MLRTSKAKLSYGILLLALAFPVGRVGAQPSGDMVGLWWISHGDGAPLQMRVYADGTAWSDYPANNPGRWHMDGDRLVCVWADDWKEVLVRSPRGWSKLGYEPGTGMQSPPSNRSHAVRVTSEPDGWFGMKARP
jgi:hypothetical protein